jgi:hypothetical protein
MRDGTETLDVVVRSEGVALTASASVLAPGYMMLIGSLLDSDLRAPDGGLAPVLTAFRVSLSPDLVGGAHVARETDWTIELDDVQIGVRWFVEPHELPNGYALQDALARASDLDIRAFAIEDLVATVGVGLAAGIAGMAVWLHHKRAKRALEVADRQFRDCLDSGGLPTIRFGMDDEVSLTPDARLRLKAGVEYEVRCAPRPQ